MKLYLVMVDLDGTMRSSCDTPKAAFNTKEEAQEYINKNTIKKDPTKKFSIDCICGGYFAEIKEVKYHV